MNKEIQGFKDNSKNNPSWLLLYRLKWAQLADVIDLKNLMVLDFGSGFGTTANHLAKDNEVIAIEPNADMLAKRECINNYTQIIGKYEKLKNFENNYFDVIVCHNVLEFAPERCEIVKEFSRILKNDGVLSIVKNNSHGRIMSMAVANNIDKAVELLDGGHIANVFGKVVLYDPEELVTWTNNLKIEKILALKTFYGLQQNDDIKFEPEWLDKMFNIEMKVADMEPYKSISLFHHVLLKKRCSTL